MYAIVTNSHGCNDNIKTSDFAHFEILDGILSKFQLL